MEQKPKRNVWLDIFRYFLAFLVVSIHTCASIGGFVFLPLSRIAVPMFFMLSGYFAYRQTYEKELDSAKRALKRNFIYMIITITVITSYNILRILIKGESLVAYINNVLNRDIFFNFFFCNTIYGIVQGWFIIALFLISVVHYFLVKYKHTNLLNFLLPVCLILMFTPYLYKICRGENLQLEYYRNWLILGFPCFSIGYILNKYIKNNDKAWMGILELFLALVFIVTSFLEDKFLTRFEYYFSSFLSAICFILFFDFTRKVKRNKKFAEFEETFSNLFYNWIGAKGSFFIFVFHISISTTLTEIIHVVEFSQTLLVFFTTFVLYEILFLLNKLIKKIKLHIKAKCNT